MPTHEPELNDFVRYRNGYKSLVFDRMTEQRVCLLLEPLVVELRPTKCMRWVKYGDVTIVRKAEHAIKDG